MASIYPLKLKVGKPTVGETPTPPNLDRFLLFAPLGQPFRLKSKAKDKGRGFIR